MVIAGVVIRTLPGRAPAVAERLESVPGLTVHGNDDDGRIAAVWRADSGEALEEAGEALVELDEEVLGVYPSFVGDEGGEGAERVEELEA